MLAENDQVSISRSFDAGTTFANVTSFDFIFGIQTPRARMVFDPFRPGSAFLLLFTFGEAADAVVRTTDHGATWVALENARGIRDLAVTSSGALLAATFFGVAHSDDGGSHWLPPLDSYPASTPPYDTITRLLAPRRIGSAIYAAGATGVWRSFDEGTTWSFASQGITAQAVYSVAFAPVGPRLGLSFDGTAVQRTLDGGTTWRPVHRQAQGPQPDRIAGFDPRRGRTAYGLGFDGQADSLYRTRDGGRTWSKLDNGYNCGGDSICDVELNAFAIDPQNPNRIYVGGFYFFHFGGSGTFLLRSDDGFVTAQSLSGLPHPAVLVLRRTDEALLGLACDGLRQSRDGGTTWVKIGNGLPTRLCSDFGPASSIALDPVDPRRIYVGARSGGAFVSVDGGRSFAPLGTRLAHARISVLLAPGGADGRLVAGVPGKGVFVWDTERGEWGASNRGLPAATFDAALASDPRHPDILFAGAGGGLFRLDLDAP